MMRISKFFSCFALLLLFLSQAIAVPNSPALDVIERLNTALLDVMKNSQSLGYQGRYDKLARVINETHDLAYIARFAIGKKYWNQLDVDQQTRYVDVFTDFSVAAYAYRFDGYAGETFRIDSEKPMKRGRIQVLSYLSSPSQSGSPGNNGQSDLAAIDFNYVLREQEGGWKIINIVVQGVSDLALKRAEYRTLIQEDGFDALIKHISDKSQSYTKKASG